jgi:uncharacterized metal-binding protein YceD (DUF177 family)
MEAPLTTELYRPVNLERIFHNRSKCVITASETEKVALAKRFNLISVDTLEASYDVKPSETKHGGFYVTGKLYANAVQRCVATLAPVREEINADISIHVVDQKYISEDPLDPEQDEDFEYSDQGEIDLGEITSQYLSLSLNPYPRAPEADQNKTLEKFKDKQNPFAALEKLKHE